MGFEQVIHIYLGSEIIIEDLPSFFTLWSVSRRDYVEVCVETIILNILIIELFGYHL